MFLATTALNEFWDVNGPVLFLGRWCVRPQRRTEWAHLNHEVLPSAWTDRERFHRAARYVDDCGELLLARLGEYLNAVHGKAYSRRYWRVVLGNWLGTYLHAGYDRYVHLGDAFARYPDLRTIVLDAESFDVPHNTREMVWGLKNDDRWNLQLVSQLLVAMGYAFDSRRSEASHTPDTGRPPDRPFYAAPRRILRFAEDVAGSMRAAGPDAVLYSMEVMGHRAAWHLALASRFRIVPVGPRPAVAPVPAAFDDRRSGLAALQADDAFQRAAVLGLPHFLPTVFLEGYEATRRRALTGWSRIPRVIVSATGWNHDEAFKVFAAEAAEAGTRLVAVQHGGTYGFAREVPSEVFERRLSDAFVTWGWADAPSLRNLPSPKLSQLCSRLKRRRGGGDRALFIATLEKRYPAQLHSAPVGTLAHEYLETQLRFLRTLSEETRRRLRLRPYPGVAHPLRSIIDDQYGEVQWDGGGSLYVALETAPLVVIDHPETTILETLAANIPTLLFWDQQYWEMRPSAEPYFEALRAAGVLHATPEAAAAVFSTVVDDVTAWWQNPVVQHARRTFVDRFALNDSGWAAAWLAAIRAEIAAATDGTRRVANRPAMDDVEPIHSRGRPA
jgi:putative transferase (TIGR04331 family)